MLDLREISSQARLVGILRHLPQRVGILAVIALAIGIFPGCAPGTQHESELVSAKGGIQERLLETISADGFDYDFLSSSQEGKQVDMINIRLSLDSIKGRHLSLEKLMTDIGRVCALPAYAHVPVRIRIGAGDEEDQAYLHAILATAVRGSDNVTLIPVDGLRNEVVITLHPPLSAGK